jgi:hypothetical protein
VQKKPERLSATYHRTHGIRYFHGCYSIGDDRLWGVTRRRKGGDHSLAALKSIRAARPDGAPIYVIMDNLSANKTPAIRAWVQKKKAELCLTPTSASWANPIEAQFGPLRNFVMGGSNHPNHTVLARNCRTTCGGATPTPDTPTSSPPNAANVPKSAANDTNAGADHDLKPHDQPRRRFVDNALGRASADPPRRAQSDPPGGAFGSTEGLWRGEVAPPWVLRWNGGCGPPRVGAADGLVQAGVVFDRIRRDSWQLKLSIRALSRKYWVHRRLVREALASPVTKPRKRPVRISPRMEPYKKTVDEWLRADLEAPRKQRHTAKRIGTRLEEEFGVTLPYTTVRDFVTARRRAIAAEVSSKGTFTR